MVPLNSQAARYIFRVIALHSEFSFWGILPTIQILSCYNSSCLVIVRILHSDKIYDCGIAIAFQYQLQNFNSC